jgi:hypothetical protein
MPDALSYPNQARGNGHLDEQEIAIEAGRHRPTRSTMAGLTSRDVCRWAGWFLEFGEGASKPRPAGRRMRHTSALVPKQRVPSKVLLVALRERVPGIARPQRVARCHLCSARGSGGARNREGTDVIHPCPRHRSPS